MSSELIVPVRFQQRGRIAFEIIDHADGSRRWVGADNTVTDNMRDAVANALAALSTGVPSHIALATGAIKENSDATQDATATLGSDGTELAQGVDTGGTAYAVLLLLKRLGTSAGTLTIELQGDSAGFPNGTPITNGTSEAVSINGLSTTYAWQLFTFASQPAAFSTASHIVLKSSGYTYSAGVTEVSWGIDESAPAYAGGALAEYNGSWAAHTPAADACFRVIGLTANTMTALDSEQQRNAITAKAKHATYKSRLLAIFAAGEATGYTGQVGMFDASSSGNLLAVANKVINKQSSQQVNVYWITEIQAV